MNRLALLLLLSLAAFLYYLCYTVVAPFLPPEIARRGLSPLHNGLIIAFLAPPGFLMPALLSAWCIPRYGLSCTLSLGAVATSAALTMYGAAYYCSDNVAFLFLSYTGRLLQGVAGSTLFQAAWAIVAIVFADNMARATSIFTVGMTLGLAGGPFLGGVLFSLFGYPGPFFTFAALAAVFQILKSFCNLEANLKTAACSQAAPADEDLSLNEVGVKDIFKRTTATLGLATSMLAIGCLCFFEPILAGKLAASLDYSSDQVAFFYARFTLACLAGNVLLIFVPWKDHLLAITSLGAVSASLGCLLMAPEGLLGLDNTTPEILTVGLVLLAAGAEMLLNAAPPHIVGTLIKDFPNSQEAVGKLFAKVRIILSSIGFLVAPFMASVVTQLASYEATCDGMALLLLLFLSLYLSCRLWSDRSRRMGKGSCALSEPLLKSELGKDLLLKSGFAREPLLEEGEWGEADWEEEEYKFDE